MGVGLLAILGCPGSGHDVSGWALDDQALADTREPCSEHNAQRNLYFGDLHVHTSYSFDAAGFAAATNTPWDAYRFAKGEALCAPPYDASDGCTRKVTLARPLDFVAVTDHSEFLGETNLCTDPTSTAYASKTCQGYREKDLTSLSFGPLSGELLATYPEHPALCETASCAEVARTVWGDIQDAAEAAYDRTSACRFTSFVGYEWSATPLGNNLHRNVIFRNSHVPEAPTSYIDAPKPEQLWDALEMSCLNANTGCDVLAIPHNSNLSAGHMFVPSAAAGRPYDAAQALRRQTLEPLMEIYQHKGASECMTGWPNPLATEDELCTFENVHRPLCTGAPSDAPDCTPLCSVQPGIGFLYQCADPTDFARGALGVGLQVAEQVGVNPFELGFIGSTDTHNATPGLTDEEGSYRGHFGAEDDTLKERLSETMRVWSPGGLAAVWAEENSRDAIFDALRRKETYATSGTRMAVRFFGGWSYAKDVCRNVDPAAAGYEGGVAMGGRLGPPPSGATAPRFLIWAFADPGVDERPGTPLERIQIVKGWVENGTSREKVFDVVGEITKTPDPNTRNCEPWPKGAGASSLCEVWTDPDFRKEVGAFYYARVLELPTCRYSTLACAEKQVNCSEIAPDDPLSVCCDAQMPRTIQERAWTSPIWYANQ